MKILIMLLVLSSMAYGAEPKFMKGQKVTYVVPKFYKLVCTGKGTVERYNADYETYTVTEGLNSDDCPDLDGLKEKDIQARE
jgi:hypothetical protein